jgi:hypothetical protein
VRSIVACVLVLSACSFAGVESARYVAPDRVECHADIGLPIADGVVGVAGLVTAGALSASAEGKDSLTRDFERARVATAGIIGALYAVSAIYGFTEVQRCERAEEQSRARWLAAHERAEARSQAQDAAWQATKQAAYAARVGDCASVLAADAEVRALDAEFHDTVFAHDVAIARCLAPASAAR